MTLEEKIKADLEIARKRTPGVWETGTGPDPDLGYVDSPHGMIAGEGADSWTRDTDFIAHAANNFEKYILALDYCLKTIDQAYDLSEDSGCIEKDEAHPLAEVRRILGVVNASEQSDVGVE